MFTIDSRVNIWMVNLKNTNSLFYLEQERSHTGKKMYDRQRDAYLAWLGILTIRYTNEEVLTCWEGIYEDIFYFDH